MRHLLLLSIFFFFYIVNTFAQTYSQKDMVLLEIATGTWCSYCPGAAMGADDMHEEGLSVAIIENHNSDAFANSGSDYRNGYYGISGYPTAVFNGTAIYEGGSSSTSVYPAYKSLYNRAIEEVSHYSLSLNVANLGNGSYAATVLSNDIAKRKADADSIYLYIVLTESHIQYNWMNQTELNFVNRLMINGNQGTHICYSCSGTFYETFNFSIDESWNIENLEVVAFIQDMNSKEVMQTSKDYLPELIVNNDVAFVGDVEIEQELCSSIIKPTIEIKNKGVSVLEDLTVKYIANVTDTFIYNWYGYLSQHQTQEISLPEIEISAISGSNSLVVQLIDPNGESDEIISDNFSEISFERFWQKSNFLEVKIATDFYGEETTWELLNSVGDVVLNGGPYTSGLEYRSFLKSENNACYTFKVFDSGNNGVSEDGHIRLVDYYSQKIIYNVPEFTDEHEVTFGTDYKAKKSLELKTKLGKLVANNDTVFIEGYRNDTAQYELFKLYNMAPLQSFVNIDYEILEQEQGMQHAVNWANKIVDNPEDSLIIEGLNGVYDFSLIYKSNKLVGEQLMQYKLWANNDTTDVITWYVNYKAVENPPVKLNILSNENQYYQTGDTIVISEVASKMQNVSFSVNVENSSSIPVEVGCKAVLLSAIDGHQVNYDFADGVNIVPGDMPVYANVFSNDTIKTFKAKFSANDLVGQTMVRYIFSQKQDTTNFAEINVLYNVLANPNFGITVAEGADTIKYELNENSQDRIITSIPVYNSGNYAVDIKLARSVLEGLGTFIDTTYWAGNYYLGAHREFPEVVNIAPGETNRTCMLVFYPPFKAGEYLINLNFFEKENMENGQSVCVKYTVDEEIIGKSVEENFIKTLVYPNPTNSKLIIEPSGFEDYNLSIYSVNGKLVFNKNCKENSVINIKNLDVGVYYLIKKSEYRVERIKVVKE